MESGEIVKNVFFFVAVISVSLLVLITFLMIYFVIRYRRSKHPEPVDIRGSTWLEVLWTIIPTVLVMVMFYYGLKGFQVMKKPPEGAMKIKVSSGMWSWGFEYENGVRSAELTVPAGRPILLLLTSRDVIHSFYVPAFKIKQDAVPGMENRLWFRAEETGTHDVLCAEYCGLRHSYMLTKMHVLPEEAFRSWYEGEKKKVEAAGVKPTGLQLLEQKG